MPVKFMPTETVSIDDETLVGLLPGKENEDKRRALAMALDSLREVLNNLVCLRNSGGRAAAISLYRRILELANGDEDVFKIIIPSSRKEVTIDGITMTVKDVLFCIKMMSAESELAREAVMVKWAEHNFGSPVTIARQRHVRVPFPQEHFKFFFGNEKFSENLGLIYATLILGEKDARFLQETAGIRHFLRYPPKVLEYTRDYFQGKLSGGRLSVATYSYNDHNGTFNGNYRNFEDAYANGYPFIAIEWSNPNELVSGLEKIVALLKEYNSRGVNFELDTMILAGHGNLRGVGWGRGSENTQPVLDVSDEKIFKKLKAISKDLHFHFKQLFIFACTTLGTPKEKKDDPNFVCIAKIIKDIGIAAQVYASTKYGITYFTYNEAAGTLIPQFTFSLDAERYERMREVK